LLLATEKEEQKEEVDEAITEGKEDVEIGKSGLESAGRGLEVASNKIPENVEACTGDFKIEESGQVPAGNSRECATSTASPADPSKISKDRD
jgi:hypothetical protein